MTHHGHLVKSRLAIKYHKIIVLHVSLNLQTHYTALIFLTDVLRRQQYVHKQR